MWSQGPVPLVLSHRGHHVRERENTIAAFDAAVAVGAHGIEFDVRATRRGALVVHHDEKVRLGARRRRLIESDRRELPGWVPTLKETLRWARKNPRILLDMEIKEPGTEGEAMRLVEAAHLTERTIVTSFHPDVCFQVRDHFSETITGFLLEEAVPEAVDVAVEAGAKLLVVHRSAVDAGLVVAARARGLDVWAWGANRVHDARALVDAGVRGIITDRADRILPPSPRAKAPTGRRQTVPGRGRRGS